MMLAEPMLTNEDLATILVNDPLQWETNTTQPNWETLILIEQSLKCETNNLVRTDNHIVITPETMTPKN